MLTNFSLGYSSDRIYPNWDLTATKDPRSNQLGIQTMIAIQAIDWIVTYSMYLQML